jgi:hypothetical protein
MHGVPLWVQILPQSLHDGEHLTISECHMSKQPGPQSPESEATECSASHGVPFIIMMDLQRSPVCGSGVAEGLLHTQTSGFRFWHALRCETVTCGLGMTLCLGGGGVDNAEGMAQSGWFNPVH